MNNNFHRPVFIGPMSKNIVDAVVSYNVDKNNMFGLIPSRRQVECQDLGGGYVNNWTTEKFSSYAEKTLVLRDHAGPLQGLNKDDGLKSLSKDVESGVIFLHIDPWKAVTSIEEAALETSRLIDYCLSLDDNCVFEIGTESAIFPYTASDLRQFLLRTRQLLGPEKFSKKIIYAVVQSGTQVLATGNIGSFNQKESSKMCQIVHSFDLLAKEHNSDYLSEKELCDRKEAGVDSFNIAPEFGVAETLCVLELLGENLSLKDDFIELCYQSNKWKKWVREHPTNLEATKICGHYAFSQPEFIKIKDDLKCQDFDVTIERVISEKLNRLTRILG